MSQMLQILKILKIYFDTCCYGRPQDDQTQPAIEAETIAIINIILFCRIAGHSIIGSPTVKKELWANPDADVRKADWDFFRDTINSYVTTTNPARVRTLNAQGLGVTDSLHLATAEIANADFLITVDKDFERIAVSRKLSQVRVINPLDFIKEVTK